MAVNSKHAFWQALIVTIAIFLIGIFIGIVIEDNRAAEANEAFLSSQLFLTDSLALSNLAQISEGGLGCESMIDTNIQFANKVYDEAVLFEAYRDSEILTEGVKIVLKRYDLLRTLLWINTLDIPEECFEETSTSTIVYLFDRNSEDVEMESQNRVWSRILFEIKQEKGNEVILIPIGADKELVSLNSLISKFEIEKYPAIIINNEHVITEIKSAEELKEYLR